MSLLAVVNLLWLSSVTLTDAWPCSCDNNGCNIYNMAVLMYRSMDKTIPDGNLLISPVGLWIVLIYAQNMAILLSLIKFQDKWRYPFFITDEKKYASGRYELMHTSGLFFYAYDANHGNSYIFLDYQHRSLSMVLVLPDSNSSKVETSWDMFYPKDKQVSHLNLSIPKFTFEVEYSLKQVIYDINCEILFSKKCDLSGLNGMKAPVSQIVQRTFVRVDEEGVMFEAHTILVSEPSGSPRDQPYVGSSANQPFMFYLFYDKYVIAQGRIIDPFI